MRISLYALWLLAALLPVAAYAAEGWGKQRLIFEDAYQRAAKLTPAELQDLSKRLADYPIIHYLRFANLQARLDKAAEAEVLDLLNAYPASPPAGNLRRAWLRRMAEQKRWAEFLRAWQPQKDTGLQCLELQARLQTGLAAASVTESAMPIWLAGDNLPAACENLFAALPMPPESGLQRLRTALEKGNGKAAEQTAKAVTDKKAAQLWLDMAQKPAAALTDLTTPDSEDSRALRLLGLTRLAKDDATAAHELWQSYAKQYAFSPQQSGELSRHIAMQAAFQKLPQALEWLKQVEPAFATPATKQLRLQLALRAQDWKEVQAHVEALPAEDQTVPQWRYWKARALEASGQADAAQALLTALAGERDFYGFMAAEKTRKLYHFRTEATPQAAPEESEESGEGEGEAEAPPAVDPHDKLLQIPALLRARELFMTSLSGYARQEWQAGLEGLSAEDVRLAAELAGQLGWHDRAIATATKAAAFDLLELRFPTPFYDDVIAQAEDKSLNYAWVYAIIRQESAFQTDARSSANALGLMQLLPATARDMAKRLKIPLKDDMELIEPVKNIRLGAEYLNYLLKQFNGNHLLATAAYNAGPSRSKRWAAEFGCLPADIWVELIPFSQTRDYVQRVLAYTVIFDHRISGRQEVEPMLLDAVKNESCP
jgi:soluble lytic murein transglycosylase